jgi:hypothetical protein
MSMILKYVKNGIRVHGPPYTKEEEADFYSRNANGPVTIARGAGGPTAPQSSTAASVTGKASPRPELENSQD